MIGAGILTGLGSKILGNKAAIGKWLLAMAIGAGIALYFDGILDDAARANAAEAAMEAQNEAVKRAVKQQKEISRINSEILESHVAQLEKRADRKQEKVKVYVSEEIDASGNCNMPVGVKRVLDYVLGADPTGARLPDAAGLSEKEARASSSITPSQFYEVFRELGNTCVANREQLNLLLDWHDARKRSSAQ